MKASSVLLGLAPLAALAAPTPEAELSARQAQQSIDALMKAKGKLYFGTATDVSELNVSSLHRTPEADFVCFFSRLIARSLEHWQELCHHQGRLWSGHAREQHEVAVAREHPRTVQLGSGRCPGQLCRVKQQEHQGPHSDLAQSAVRTRPHRNQLMKV